MASPNGYSLQLVAALLQDSSTFLSPGPSSASTGTITQGFYLPLRLAAGASNTNVKLGTLTNPKFLAVFGGQGVSFKIISTGDNGRGANPFGFLSDVDDGIGDVSQIWLSNSDSEAHEVEILAGE